ncbi:hypothetical protein AYO21_02926 [Fonsecaea monophora]|uniref:Uncharacterized protein n=1 Tax=Fonsecaea monophora TaxID=254056 RepID=A0A177FFJ0_9EURO|nr:hypothetical protein AYO21_02926 [Fonsecaea monophora]KAH0847644.1 hypothetical protein FOPE_00874 [Fonsecaea pedrosoi]OAG42975.1 hypothetical protein AYO21_02926 [Fonsecaea monophora]
MSLPVEVKDGHKLPGAILFMTVTTKVTTTNPTAASFNVIAYDPLIDAQSTPDKMKARYTASGLPYFERFTTPPEAEAPFQVKNGEIFYCGTYGTTAADKSLAWTHWVKGSISPGISLAYWNQEITEGGTKRVAKGCFTAPAGKRFTSASKTPIMSLYQAKGGNVLDERLGTPMGLSKCEILWYATHIQNGVAGL